jgi:hypothetical protein
MLVVDNGVMPIINQTLTPSAFTDNREFGVVTNQPDAIQAAVAIFVANWNI